MNQAAFDCLSIALNPAIDHSLSIPHFAAGKVNRVAAEESRPAGKGVNVGVAVARAGFRVAVSGFLGEDNAGSFESLFRKYAVVDECVRIAGSTRTGIKITDPANQTTTDINFPGAEPTADDVAGLRERIASLDARWAVLAGSLPPGVPVSIYAELTADLMRRGIRVAVDTSDRPLQFAIAAKPSVIKPNIHELEAITGRALKTQAAVLKTARDLVQSGIECVIVSMGAEGALFVTAAEALLAVPPPLLIRTTVGAGDAMVAGWIAASLRGLPLEKAARLATAFSLAAIDVSPRDEPRSYFPCIQITQP